MSNNVKVDDLSVGIRLQQKDSLLMVLTVIELWRVELRSALAGTLSTGRVISSSALDPLLTLLL